MKHIFLLVFVTAIALFVTSCETNPPDSVNQIETSGYVTVTSNIDSAAIYLNDTFTGHYTPATIEVNEGNHTIRLEKDYYLPEELPVSVTAGSSQDLVFTLSPVVIQKVVLLEDFSNTSCVPCVASNKIVEQIKESYSTNRMVVLKTNTSFPYPGDPFYLENKSYSDSRSEYYNVFSTPTIKIDGIITPAAADSNDIKDALQSRLQTSPVIEFNIESTIAGLNYNVDVAMDVISTNGIDFNNSALFVLITETDIDFDAPNGESVFHDVARVSLTGNNGESLASITSTGKKTFSYNTTLKSDWNTNKIHTLVFVQNLNTKEVYQTGSDHQ